jgi:hypothetical protein
MRITVRRVLELLASYPDQSKLLADYSYLEAEDLQQALHYAIAAVDDELLPIDRVAWGPSSSTRVSLLTPPRSFERRDSIRFTFLK